MASRAFLKAGGRLALGHPPFLYELFIKKVNNTVLETLEPYPILQIISIPQQLSTFMDARWDTP